MVEATKSSTLAVPNVLYVAALAGGNSAIVHVGPAAGWIVPRGIRQWEREAHVVQRDALTDDVKRDLGIVMPEEQIPAAKLPLTHRAASMSPLVGVAGAVATKLPGKGVRVHTVGFDRISGGFYYFAEGGTGEPVRVQGDLIEMSGSVLETTSNADLEVYLDGLIDRLLVEFSGGEINEMSVELADRLPKAASDGSGLADVDLDAFEREATGLAMGAERYESSARSLAAKLVEAGKKGDVLVKVPLFGEAKREPLAAVDLEVGGARKKLPAHNRWVVFGDIRDDAAVVVLEKPVEAKPAPAAVAAPVVEKLVERAVAAKPVEAKPAAAKATPVTETNPVVETKAGVETKPVVVVQAKPIESKPAVVQAKPAETKPVEAKPAVVQAKPAETRPAEKVVEKAAASDRSPKAAAPRPEKSPMPAAATAKPVEAKVEAKPERAATPAPKVDVKTAPEPESELDSDTESESEAEAKPLETRKSVAPKKGGKAAAKQAKLDAKRAGKEAKRAEAKATQGPVSERPAESKRPEKMAESKRPEKLAAKVETKAAAKEPVVKDATKKEAKAASEESLVVPTESSSTWKIALAVLVAAVVAYFVYMNVLKK